MLVVTGVGSNIFQCLLQLLPKWEKWEGRRIDLDSVDWPIDADRYLFCSGVINADLRETLNVNMIYPIRVSDFVLNENPKARICIIGSESAYTWSYDALYAASKVAIHRYVETKRLPYPDQQLVCVAPSIIEDCGMTLRRKDKKALAKRADALPKKRWLKAMEVAKMVYHLLYVDAGYTTGVVIRMNGGAHCVR